jgi:hypothetical protein
MATKRTRRTIERRGISVEALEAWRAGDLHGLMRALGLRPWDYDPFHVGCETPQEWVLERDRLGTDAVAGAANWRHAWELRCALEEMGGPPGRHDIHGRPLGPSATSWKAPGGPRRGREDALHGAVWCPGEAIATR